MSDVRVNFVTSGQEILTGALRTIGGGFVTLAADAISGAASAMADFATESFKGAIDAQKGMDILTASIERAGAASPITTQSAFEMADAFKNLVGGSDDVVLAMQNVGLRFDKIGADVFPQFIESSADMAAALSIDPVKAAELLGKTLQDISIDGVGSLGKLKAAGVALTEAQEKQILAMVESGDAAGAQKLVMDALAETIGGSAATNAKTAAGQWAIFNESIGDAGEGIALTLLPPLTNLMGQVLPPLTLLVQDVAGAFGAFLDILLSGDIGGAIGVFGEFETFDTIFGALGIHINDIGSAVEGFIEGAMSLGPILSDLFDTITGQTDPTEKFLSLWESVSEVFGPETADAVVGFVETAMTNLENLKSTAVSVFASFQPVVGALVELWETKLAPAFAVLFADVSENAPSTQEIFAAAMEGIRVGAQVVADFLVNVVIPGIATLVDWFMANWPTIKATGESVMQGLQTAIQTVLDAVSAFWSEWGDEITGAFDSYMEQIKTLFGAFEKAFKGDWKGFGEDLRKGWDAAWEKIQKIVTDGIDAITKVDWASVGENIIKGVAGGISSATHFIVEAAVSAAQAAFAAAKGFLGIESPSKLFATVGQNMMMGWAQGITGNAGLPAYATMGAAYATTIAVGGISISGADGPMATAMAIENVLEDLAREGQSRARLR